MNFSKLAFSAAFILTIPFSGIAQGNLSHEKGDVIINPFITLGWYNYSYGYESVSLIPPVGINFEYAVSPFFSWGLQGEYGSRQYRDFGFILGGNEYKYEYKTIGLRGSFHYLDFLKDLLEDKLGSLNAENIDFYVGLTASYLITNSTRSWNDGVAAEDHELKTFNSNVRLDYFAGFRYYIKPSFGAFLETGNNSLGWAKLGLTFKF